MHLSKCLGSFAKVWGVHWFGAFRSDHALLRETAKKPKNLYKPQYCVKQLSS